MSGVSSILLDRIHRPRVIPVLLLRRDGLLYKTRKFAKPKYVGDPRIAVKIFNDKGADEIAILDIEASRQGRTPRYELIEEIASEAFMPLAYGGGITTFDQVRRVLELGAEKVILNSHAIGGPDFVRKVADAIGSQSVVVSVDAKRDLLGRYRVVTHGATKRTRRHPVSVARDMASAGAGELLLTSVDRDGTFEGYDLSLTKSVASAVTVPVIACGGAGSVDDIRAAIRDGGASAAAAGSIFIFQGPHRAVLIKFPDDSTLKALFE